MQCQTLLTFHANQKVKLPLIPQFPLYKASKKTRKLSHKTQFTSSPFRDVLWQRMITVLDVLFLLIWSASYPLVSSAFIKWLRIVSGLYLISDVRFFVPYYFDCGYIPLCDRHIATNIPSLTTYHNDLISVPVERLKSVLNNHLYWKFLSFIILVWSSLLRLLHLFAEYME